MRGYFAALPDLLSSKQGQGIAYLYANDAENQLNETVMVSKQSTYVDLPNVNMCAARQDYYC